MIAILTDLAGFEWLLDLLVVGEKPDVGADLGGGGAQRGQRADDGRVGLARVRLTRHRKLLFKSGKLRHLQREHKQDQRES